VINRGEVNISPAKVTLFIEDDKETSSETGGLFHDISAFAYKPQKLIYSSVFYSRCFLSNNSARDSLVAYP